jgi:hypothetical protein
MVFGGYFCCQHTKVEKQHRVALFLSGLHVSSFKSQEVVPLFAI